MFLSIIIPVYNVESFLRECLDSLFAQDLADCEVIAVNDGSTDDSPVILSEYVARYPELLRVVSKENGGLSSARNAGVECAQGDYLYFVDSDDWLKPHAIASIRRAVEVSESADVIYLDCIVTDQGKRWAEQKMNDIPLMSFRSFFNFAYEHKMGIAPNAFSYVYSSSFWRKSGLHYEEGIKYEDALFKYQLFVREDGTIKAIHEEEPFYVYRVGREGSLSTKLTLKNFADRQFVRERIASLLSENCIEEMSFRHALFDHGLSVLLEAYRNGFLNQWKQFWSKQDFKWMRRGVSNRKEYLLYLLARIDPRWMARYYYGELPSALRRFTNIMLTPFVKLSYQ